MFVLFLFCFVLFCFFLLFCFVFFNRDRVIMACIKITEIKIKLIAIFRMVHVEGPLCWFSIGTSTLLIVSSLFDHSFKRRLVNGPSDSSTNFLLWIGVQ